MNCFAELVPGEAKAPLEVSSGERGSWPGRVAPFAKGSVPEGPL